jgi:hypothetical protein
MFNVALPLFERVTDCAALVAPETPLKVSVAGVSAAAGAVTTAAPKLAVTASGALIVTVVEALFALATLPVQFTNEKPLFGVAVRLTTVPVA